MVSGWPSGLATVKSWWAPSPNQNGPKIWRVSISTMSPCHLRRHLVSHGVLKLTLLGFVSGPQRNLQQDEVSCRQCHRYMTHWAWQHLMCWLENRLCRNVVVWSWLGMNVFQTICVRGADRGCENYLFWTTFVLIVVISQSPSGLSNLLNCITLLMQVSSDMDVSRTCDWWM